MRWRVPVSKPAMVVLKISSKLIVELLALQRVRSESQQAMPVECKERCSDVRVRQDLFSLPGHTSL